MDTLKTLKTSRSLPSLTRSSSKSKKSKGKSRAPTVEADDLPYNGPKIFLVLGPTGTGKSTFIHMATGRDDEASGVGHSLGSETKNVVEVEIPDPNGGPNILIVDTPGFEDTDIPNHEILKRIADWLHEKFTKGVRLAGVLYFHDVFRNRVSGSILDTLSVFRDICGEDAFKNVAIVLTMLDMFDGRPHDLRRRIDELEAYWKPLRDKGALVEKFDGTQARALAILSAVGDKRFFLQIQQELGEGKPLYNTKAGIRVFPPLLRWLANLIKHWIDSVRARRSAVPSSGESQSSAQGDTPSPSHRSSLDGRYPHSSSSSSSAPSSLGMSDGTGSSATSIHGPCDSPIEQGKGSGTPDDVVNSRPWDSPDTSVPEEYKAALTSAIRALEAILQREDPVTSAQALQLRLLIHDLYDETADQPADPSSKQKIDEFIALVNSDPLRSIGNSTPGPAVPPGPVPMGPTISTAGSTSSTCTCGSKQQSTSHHRCSTSLRESDTSDASRLIAEIVDGSLAVALEKIRKRLDQLVTNRTPAIHYIHRPVYIIAEGQVNVNTHQGPPRSPSLFSFLRREKRRTV